MSDQIKPPTPTTDANKGPVEISAELLDEARRNASTGTLTSLFSEVCGQDHCGGQLSGQWIKAPGMSGNSIDALIIRCDKNRSHAVKVQVRRFIATTQRKSP